MYLMAAFYRQQPRKPSICLGLEYESLFHVLNLAKAGKIKKYSLEYCRFGPTTPKENTPQYTIMEPSTVYGISKQAGER
jgi:hypothetical protein